MVRTREQDREYQREYRRQKAAQSHVTESPRVSVEDVESMVRLELDALRATKFMHASAAAALAMARVLDDAAAVPQHPAAAGQLRQIMAEIRSARAPESTSSLALIRGGRTAS